ncbi:MAG: hypothetical protein DMG07_12625 [Acidobacteria bacterium]|nr:MAG: hypothetical protein DMG07_12625 [Acidobacteriota bacterium]
MKCNKLAELIPDYLVGAADPGVRSEIDAHLSACAWCREEVEGLTATWSKLGELADEQPSPVLRERFSAMLEGYREGAASKPASRRFGFERLVLWSPGALALQFGAALLCLAAGLAAGHYLTLAKGSNGDLAEMRSEIRSMKRLVALSLLEQQSASERLRGIAYSYQIAQPDINVRLASIDALSKFSDQPAVRRGLLESLARQESPLVQIALIDLMVQTRQRESADTLRRMTRDQTLNQAVRQRAEWGLREIG